MSQQHESRNQSGENFTRVLSSAEKFSNFLLQYGLEGNEKIKFKSAETIADEAMRSANRDRNKAIKKIIATHTRTTGFAGFVTGLGGLATMPISVPADLAVYYMQATRMVGAIAHVQGYDLSSDEVRSIVLVSLIGAVGSEAVAKLGVEVTGKAGVAALKKLPGKVLTKINKKVGFRLLTKFGEKGTINLVKAVPFVASGVGASMNMAGMAAIGKYAKANFPYESWNGFEEDDEIIDADILDD